MPNVSLRELLQFQPNQSLDLVVSRACTWINALHYFPAKGEIKIRQQIGTVPDYPLPLEGCQVELKDNLELETGALGNFTPSFSRAEQREFALVTMQSPRKDAAFTLVHEAGHYFWINVFPFLESRLGHREVQKVNRINQELETAISNCPTRKYLKAIAADSRKIHEVVGNEKSEKSWVDAEYDASFQEWKARIYLYSVCKAHSADTLSLWTQQLYDQEVSSFNNNVRVHPPVKYLDEFDQIFRQILKASKLSR